MVSNIQIKSVTGVVLFEYKTKNNSIKITVEKAVEMGISLCHADLMGADLSDADLSKTNLYKANFNEAYLNNTDLDESNFNKAKIIPFIPTYLPEGEFIGWKKLSSGIIVKLKILEDSKRSRATGDKCRCDKALVMEFQDEDGDKLDDTIHTNTNHKGCVYTLGEVVYADSWDDNRWNECTHGIHFFIDRESAVKYSL